MTPVKAGLLGKKQGYLPTREAINAVVDLVRAELLEEGEVTEDVAALVILLEQGKCLKPTSPPSSRRRCGTNSRPSPRPPLEKPSGTW